MTAVSACRACGTEPLENARFCQSCGSPVTEPESRRVQAGDGAVRRCCPFDGHRYAGRCGAVTRDHDRIGQPREFAATASWRSSARRWHWRITESGDVSPIRAPGYRFACRACAGQRGGDPDGAIPVIQKSVDEVVARGRGQYRGSLTGVLVETLLDRGADGDTAEAETAIARLAAAPTAGSVIRDVFLLRLRALLARGRGDETGYRECRDRYRALATSLGFEGHMDLAEAMP